VKIDSPEGELLNILDEISPLVWRRYQQRHPEVKVGNALEREDRSGYPPYFAFRFKDESEEVVNKLRLLVEGYTGNVSWQLVEHKRDGLPGRNWMIGPSRLWEVSENAARENMTPGCYLSKNEPWIGPVAYNDLDGLFQSIRVAFFNV
jgi:hypothetical protein